MCTHSPADATITFALMPRVHYTESLSRALALRPACSSCGRCCELASLARVDFQEDWSHRVGAVPQGFRRFRRRPRTTSSWRLSVARVKACRQRSTPSTFELRWGHAATHAPWPGPTRGHSQRTELGPCRLTADSDRHDHVPFANSRLFHELL